MSQIDELISKLQEVSNHPQKTVLNYTTLRKKSYTLQAISR